MLKCFCHWRMSLELLEGFELWTLKTRIPDGHLIHHKCRWRENIKMVRRNFIKFFWSLRISSHQPTTKSRDNVCSSQRKRLMSRACGLYYKSKTKSDNFKFSTSYQLLEEFSNSAHSSMLLPLLPMLLLKAMSTAVTRKQNITIITPWLKIEIIK